MKKRVLILITAILLFAVMLFPVGAVAYGRGTTIDHAGAPETISVLYNEIYDQYGVDAFFVTWMITSSCRRANARTSSRTRFLI